MIVITYISLIIWSYDALQFSKYLLIIRGTYSLKYEMHLFVKNSETQFTGSENCTKNHIPWIYNNHLYYRQLHIIKN